MMRSSVMVLVMLSLGVTGQINLFCSRLPLVFLHCDCSDSRAMLRCSNGIAKVNGPLPKLPIGILDLTVNKANVTSVPMGSLPFTLVRLVLRQNSLKTLPGDLPMSLITVDIYNNSLTDLGTLPTLPNLQHIDATSNNLHSLPSRWTPTLIHLELNNNNIRAIPDLYNTNIVQIDAHHNMISSIERLPKSLQQLHLPWNKMTSMDFLFKTHFDKLQVIDLFGNPDFNLNRDKVNLSGYYNPTLKDLRIGDTDTHSFPSWICSVFPNLSHLNFYNGRIEGIFAEPYTSICNQTTTVELHGNLLSGGIDVPFVKKLFPNLKYLTLSASLVKCSCDLYTYIKQYNIIVQDTGAIAQCGSPDHWRGFLLAEKVPPVNCNVPPLVVEEGGTGSDTTPAVYIIPILGLLFIGFLLILLAVGLRRRARRKTTGGSEATGSSNSEAPMNGHHSLQSKRRAMKLPRSVMKADDVVVPLSQRRRFKDLKFDEAAYLMPLSERAKMANGGRTVSGVYENDRDTNDACHYIDLDELDFPIPAEQPYNQSEQSNVEMNADLQEENHNAPVNKTSDWQEQKRRDENCLMDNYRNERKDLQTNVQNPMYLDKVKSGGNGDGPNALGTCRNQAQYLTCETNHTRSDKQNHDHIEDYSKVKDAYLTMLADKTYISILPEPVLHRLHGEGRAVMRELKNP